MVLHVLHGSSFPRRRESILILLASCKAKLSLACGEQVTFAMTPGILPFAAPRPASLFAPLLRRSAQKWAKG